MELRNAGKHAKTTLTLRDETMNRPGVERARASYRQHIAPDLNLICIAKSHDYLR